MKIGKTTEILKKAAAVCKSKTAGLLILASLQRRRMASGPMVSKKIHALTLANRQRVDYRKASQLGRIEKGPVDFAANLSHQLEMLGQDDGHGGCQADWSLHPLFNDDNVNCCYSGDDDDVDVLLDACDQDDDDELSVLDVIRSKREVEGLEFNMEEEIDQAADMFINRFRQRLNNGF
ncbi:hypothetical protein CFC21_078493 [Triticum aestivum]|nr:uncharacterized protein LOC109752107 [Aegilops tauschii subsp. strangulata]XP_044401606.1 uncharacterized protein LOC123125141 [Triticum aestivum]KAF7073526.1 hypothetical protein CFC21_078492 [Triticum aestivum]KAF7073527.1 hypothetical protein CFC21_078493 [Triticum aestivum]